MGLEGKGDRVHGVFFPINAFTVRFILPVRPLSQGLSRISRGWRKGRDLIDQSEPL